MPRAAAGGGGGGDDRGGMVVGVGGLGSSSSAAGAAVMQDLPLLSTVLDEDPGALDEEYGGGRTAIHNAATPAVLSWLISRGAAPLPPPLALP